MTPASEWLKTFHDGSGMLVLEASITAQDIEAIQADALREALTIACQYAIPRNIRDVIGDELHKLEARLEYATTPNTPRP